MCRAPLGPRKNDDGGLECDAGHGFDAARQGYVNLLTGAGTQFTPDTAAMVQARADFLGRGHYQPLAEAIAALAAEGLQPDEPEPVIVDAGAGTGHYLGATGQAIPSARLIALDISKFALKRASRLLPGAACLVWDVWRPLPLQDNSVSVLLNIFAPRNPQEFHRVLNANGVLIVVTPLPGHLEEIAEAASLLQIRPRKQEDVGDALRGRFTLRSERRVDIELLLTAEDIADVAAMGPAGHHHGRPDPGGLPHQQLVTASFSVQAFLRNSS